MVFMVSAMLMTDGFCFYLSQTFSCLIQSPTVGLRPRIVAGMYDGDRNRVRGK